MKVYFLLMMATSHKIEAICPITHKFVGRIILQNLVKSLKRFNPQYYRVVWQHMPIIIALGKLEAEVQGFLCYNNELEPRLRRSLFIY